MNEYQRVFLFYVFIYYLLKIGIIFACYFVVKLIEERSRQRHEQHKMFYMKKRADERKRWKVAYSSYDRQEDVPKVEPLELPKLVSNTNSFTAYSNINEGHCKLGMSA